MPQAPVPGIDPQIQAQCDAFRRDYAAVQGEIGKTIVGHAEIIDGVLTCLFVGGHALLEGVPGLGKTALIRALADALSLKFNRFFYKLQVNYSGRQELHEILNRTTSGHKPDTRPVLDAQKIIGHQQLVQRVIVAPHVQDYAIRCVLATHPQGMFAIPMVNQFLRVGASPRAAQAISLGAKVRALLDGRFHVSFKDIKEVAVPAMRHRVILNFEGEAEGITSDMVLEKVVADTPTAVQEEMATAKA